ncbi:hypothetical protein [Stenotrophomonas phage c9-N]|nr:hypothetical protein [Stenotrophomonas phage c9-N]
MNPALKTARKNVESIRKFVNNEVRLGADMDEAVEQAIAKYYSLRSEDAQADIFAAIRHVFDEHPHDGIGRKLALTEALRRYEIGRIHG